MIDDDPSHLKLYSWIINRAGYCAITVLVSGNNSELPDDGSIRAAELDYRLGMITAPEVAQRIAAKYPEIPIIVLSDLYWMPDDMAAVADGFVRKGEPQQLVDMISAMCDGRAA